MSVGKRIYLKRNMPDPELVEAFKQIPASNTADVMGRSCAMNPRIKLVSSPKAQMMAGPAYTVKCRAGDNLTLHAALNFCHEGDVLVVFSTSGSSKNCIYATICAKAKGMKVITLTGGMGGRLAPMSDVAVIVPAKETYQVQEYHLPIYHTLCLMVENEFFPE